MTIEREDDIMADVMGIPRDDGAVEPVYGRDGDRFREAPKKWWEYPDNVAQLGRAFVSWGWSAEDLQAYYEAPYRWSETWEGMSNAQQRKHFIGGEGVLPSTVEDQAAGQG